MFKKITSILLLIIMSLSFIGCSNSKTEKSNESKGKNSKEKYEYAVKISYNNKNVKEYKIDDIKKLPAESVEIEGKKQSGPLVSTILKDCKVGEFSKITFKGIDGYKATLEKEQVDNETLLDIANRGTVKLATKKIPKKDWVKDIVEITVEE